MRRLTMAVGQTTRNPTVGRFFTPLAACLPQVEERSFIHLWEGRRAAGPKIATAGLKEIEVAEDVEDVRARICRAEDQGPAVAGRRVLPHGWITLREVESDENIDVQTSRIGYVWA